MILTAAGLAFNFVPLTLKLAPTTEEIPLYLSARDIMTP
jgi:hypothetical protein